jgi:hypothetical protein
MITETDSLNCVEFEKYFVILPSTPLWNIEKFKKESDTSIGKMCEYGFSYNSGTNSQFLSVEEIRKLINTELHD